jgi:hypothetical protein
MTSYGSELERRALRQIATHFPGARVIDPATHYLSVRHWLEDWPIMVQALDAIVLFGDETGAVGAGCIREVADALCLDVTVVVLHNDGSLRELRSLRLLPAGRRTRARTAIPVAGAVVEPSEVVPRSCPSTKRGAGHGRAC